MGWIFEPAIASFDRYRTTWDDINAGKGNEILLDSIFVGALLRHFGNPDTVLGISTDATHPGFVLLDRVRPGFINTFSPSQAPVGLIMLGNEDDVLGQMDALLSGLPPYVLGLAVLQQDPVFSAFRDVSLEPRIRRVEYIRTARVGLNGTFESYWASRPKNFVADLARQRRKLRREGRDLELMIDRDPARVEECIREYGQLEFTGWKGQEGTAVSPENAQGLFYREVLERFCEKNEGVIYRLLLDGKTVACELCIERGASLMDLKTAYDEAVEGLSLGSLLEEEMIKSYYKEGRLKRVEFYGRVSDWTRKWTDDIRPLYHYNVYRYSWVARLHAKFRNHTLTPSPMDSSVSGIS
jgi:hypothetical protein